MSSLEPPRSSPALRLVVVVFLVALSAVPLGAQEASKQITIERDRLEALLKRIDDLDARVRELERSQSPARTAMSSDERPAQVEESASLAEHAARALHAAANAVTRSSQSTPAEPEPSQSDNAMMERMDVGKTLLRIRGFGDISLRGDTRKGDATSFSLGQLDLFVTSDVSDKFKFLSEIVFEAGPTDIYGRIEGNPNSFGVDIERYLLQYSYNDYINISAGRVHTAIGYYNTAYHHSSWLQTTADRPFLFDFEDHGGILPIHTVGVSVTGQVPFAPVGLHYVAELGNGRASRHPFSEESVQNEMDDQNHKAYNLALFARPEAMRGLQVGFSFYRDLLAPDSAPRISESILAAHLVLTRPKFEFLNEAILDRHVVSGTGTSFNTPGFYTQVSRQLGAWRPYLRYQYVNVPRNEPVYPDVALRHGPSLGLRYDASEAVAIKLQYDRTFLRDQPGIDSLALQLGFTF